MSDYNLKYCMSQIGGLIFHESEGRVKYQSANLTHAIFYIVLITCIVLLLLYTSYGM
jgi:hypothetical protein